MALDYCYYYVFLSFSKTFHASIATWYIQSSLYSYRVIIWSCDHLIMWSCDHVIISRAGSHSIKIWLFHFHGSSLMETRSPLAPCNMNCSCSLASMNPVCGQDKLTYFSPCHAGCKQTTKTKVSKVYFCEKTKTLTKSNTHKGNISWSKNSP